MFYPIFFLSFNLFLENLDVPTYHKHNTNSDCCVTTAARGVRQLLWAFHAVSEPIPIVVHPHLIRDLWLLDFDLRASSSWQRPTRLSLPIDRISVKPTPSNPQDMLLPESMSIWSRAKTSQNRLYPRFWSLDHTTRLRKARDNDPQAPKILVSPRERRARPRQVW